MKAICLQEPLDQTLQNTMKFTTTKSPITMTRDVLIEARGGALHFTATNLEMAIQASIPADVQEEGTLAVPNKLLMELVKTLPRDQLNLDSENGDTTLRVNWEGAHASVNGESPGYFPPVPTVDNPVRFQLSVAEFRRAVNRVLFCAAGEKGRPILTGILLQVNDRDELVTAAADGFRLARQVTVLENPPAAALELVIPAQTMTEVQRMANHAEAVEILASGTGKNVKFRIGGEEPQDTDVRVTSTLLEGNYPELSGLINRDMPNATVMDIAELNRAARRANIFAQDDAHTVRINMDPRRNHVVIDSESKEVGSSRVSMMSRETRGQPIEIAINCKYFLDLLGNLSAAELVMETESATSPARIGIPEDEDYDHVMMPIRVLTP